MAEALIAPFTCAGEGRLTDQVGFSFLTLPGFGPESAVRARAGLWFKGWRAI